MEALVAHTRDRFGNAATALMDGSDPMVEEILLMVGASLTQALQEMHLAVKVAQAQHERAVGSS